MIKYTHQTLTQKFWIPDPMLSINDKDAIEQCLLRALNDFTPRTETKINNRNLGPKDMLKILTQKQNGKIFLDEFMNYFNNSPKNQKEFDIWHHETCKLFLEYFKDDYKDLRYGKAQKIVNMTFKNIYCLQDASTKEEYFTHCHMPLDSFTIEWLYRAGKKGKKLKINNNKITLNFPSWSKLNYSDATPYFGKEKNHYYYIDIQNCIRRYITDTKIFSNDITPLQAEFLIWPQIQFELAAEGFYAQLIKLDETKKLTDANGKELNFKDKPVKEKIDWFKENVDNVNYTFIQETLENV